MPFCLLPLSSFYYWSWTRWVVYKCGGIDFIDDWILIMLVMFCKVHCWAVIFVFCLDYLFIFLNMYFLLCTWPLRENEMNAIVLTDYFVVSYEINGCCIINVSCTFVSYCYLINDFSAFVFLSLLFPFIIFSSPLFLDSSFYLNYQGLLVRAFQNINNINKVSNIQAQNNLKE